MSPKNKKNIKQILASSIGMLLFFACMFTVFVIIPNNYINVQAATVNQFTNYKEITIDYTQVRGEIHSYVFFLNLSSDADLAADCVDSGSDIAFFDSDDNQLSHLIEDFDGATGELKAKINITTLSATSNTVIKLAYNDSDIGSSAADPDGVFNTSVYEAVYLMNESSTTFYDATTNNHDSNSVGGDIPDQRDSPTGYAQHFDGTGDYILVDDLASTLVAQNSGGVLMWQSAPPDGSHNCYLDVQDASVNGDNLYFANFDRSGVGADADSMSGDLGTGGDWSPYTTSGVSDNSYKQLVWKSTGTSDRWYIDGFTATLSYDSGANDGTWFNDVDVTGNIDTVSIGIVKRDGGDAFDFTGYIDEVVFFTAGNPSDDLIHTLYNNYNNASSGGFYTVGSEQSASVSSYTINGLTSNRITFGGTAGQTVWSNSSGDGNEYLEYNMSVNETENVTQIRVYMDDQNDSGAYINASNVTMYVSSDNVSYGLMGTFTDGGSNCSNTINTTNWNAGTMGADPFVDSGGITNRTKSIYIRFKLTIPSGLGTDTFWSSGSGTCAIYPGEIT